MAVRVQEDDFDLGAELAILRRNNPCGGAIVSFVGLVRDISDDTRITEMTLEHYPGMTEKALASIEQAARQRWEFLDMLLIHRVGHLLPSEQIVLVAVLAAHRAEAFAACEFVVDYLKTQAPFWKREMTPEGARWVEARQGDADAAARWER